MNSVERVKEICKERKIPISKVERDLGYANGYIGQLKKGVFPADRLLDIAEYLGVTSEYLLTGDSKEGDEARYYLNNKPLRWHKNYLKTKICVYFSMLQKMLLPKI